MWGASELGKLGLGEVTSSDSVPVAIRSFAKGDNPYKAGAMASEQPLYENFENLRI